MVLEAVFFIALAAYLLATDPNGTSRGLPMWLVCPLLIIMMLVLGASGVRRAVKKHGRQASDGSRHVL
jgi:hypothetical protein